MDDMTLTANTALGDEQAAYNTVEASTVPVCSHRHPTRRCCCDDGVCRQYDASRRDPFWPEFAHPTWLPCAKLYNERCR